MVRCFRRQQPSANPPRDMDAIATRWSQAPNWAKLTALMALPTAGFLSARAMDDYRRWLNLGPGGLPHDIRGYLITMLITALLARSDTKSLDMYDRPEKFSSGWKQASSEEKANAQKSFLNSCLPERNGPRAAAIQYCAPQREKNADEYIDPDLAKVSNHRPRCPIVF